MESACALNGLFVTYVPAVVICEVPTGGSMSARATRAMALGTGIVAATLSLRGTPVIWTTPRDGKIAATGSANASKQEVQDRVGVEVHSAFEQLDKLKRADREHVADAVAAFLAAKDDPLVAMARKAGAP